MLSAAAVSQWPLPDQARGEELAGHEARLGDWKRRFKAEAARAIGEREAALGEWQAQLRGARAELEEVKAGMEVRVFCLYFSL